MNRRLLLINKIKDKSFIFTIDTTKAGTTGADSFLLPAQMNVGTADYAVDWGDGNGWVTGYTGHTTKTYDIGGVYTVRVKGRFNLCFFGSSVVGGEPKKVLSIEQWGITKWAAMYRMFYQTDGLIINATDEPNLTAPNISMREMFREAVGFNHDISGWGMGNVADMYGMFYMVDNQGDFDQNLGAWDISNATNIGLFMYRMKAMSTENYSDTLIGWANNPNGLQSGLSFNGGYSKYNAQGAIARQHIIDTYGWTIVDGGLDS